MALEVAMRFILITSAFWSNGLSTLDYLQMRIQNHLLYKVPATLDKDSGSRWEASCANAFAAVRL